MLLIEAGFDYAVQLLCQEDANCQHMRWAHRPLGKDPAYTSGNQCSKHLCHPDSTTAGSCQELSLRYSLRKLGAYKGESVSFYLDIDILPIYLKARNIFLL